MRDLSIHTAAAAASVHRTTNIATSQRGGSGQMHKGQLLELVDRFQRAYRPWRPDTQTFLGAVF